jgi:hypothetical protein
VIKAESSFLKIKAGRKLCSSLFASHCVCAYFLYAFDNLHPPPSAIFSSPCILWGPARVSARTLLWGVRPPMPDCSGLNPDPGMPGSPWAGYFTSLGPLPHKWDDDLIRTIS